jgi:hypothetical protein
VLGDVGVSFGGYASGDDEKEVDVFLLLYVPPSQEAPYAVALVLVIIELFNSFLDLGSECLMGL